MEKELILGVIGCGKVAESNHLPALFNIPGVKVGWLYDKSESRALLLADMYGVPWLANEEELLQQLPRTDICLLTVPYGARRFYIQQCAMAGAALYVEKPFATTEAEHREYAKLFPANRLAIGFQRRYYKSAQVVSTIIRNEIFGPLQSIEFRQGYFQLKGGAGFISDVSMSGGGVIIESGIHILDQILQFSGASDVSVTNVQSISKNGMDYDTVFNSKLVINNRFVDVSSHISSLRNLNNGLSLRFPNAVVRLLPSPDAEIHIYDKANKPLFKQYLEPMGFSNDGYTNNVNEAFLMFWRDFVQAVRSGETNRTLAGTSMLTTRWIEAIYDKIRVI